MKNAQIRMPRIKPENRSNRNLGSSYHHVVLKPNRMETNTEPT
jgi:hypothetical protein